MDKRIITKYVSEMMKSGEAVERLSNVLYVALNGDTQQSKALILQVLLQEPK